MCQCIVVVKNQLAISPQLSWLVPYDANKPFQHLCIDYLINSGPFGYRFKVNVTPDVKKAYKLFLILDFDTHGFFALGIHHKLFLTSLMFHLVVSKV
jgi:hypothetical protein